MAAVLAFTRLDLRRRWVSMIVLVLLVALAAGVVLATLAGARRTSTAISRLSAKTAPADVMVLPNQPGFDWSPVRSLPSVKSLGTFVLSDVDPTASGPLEADLDNAEGFPAGDLIQNVSLDKPAMLSGRPADPHDPDEIVVTPGFEAKYGTSITLRFPSRAQAAQVENGVSLPPSVTPHGAVAHLHVVGVGLNTFDLGPGGGPTFMPTYAFFTHYLEPLGPHSYFENARVILKGGEAAIPEFEKQLATATGNPNLQIQDAHHDVQNLQRAGSFCAIGWVLFGGIAFLASLVLVGQAFVRFSAGSAGDLATLGALGLHPADARRAAATGPAIATVLGVALADIGAIIASQWFPTGVAGKYEPEPGIRPDSLVLGLGSVAILLIGLGGSWWAARGASLKAAETRNRPSIIATTARRVGLGVPTLLGTRFALEPGRGTTRVPVRPALIGAVAGVLGVVGALTFRSGLDHTVDNPVRFGQTLPEVGFVSEGTPPRTFAPALARFAHDPDLAVLEDMRVDGLSVDGRGTSVASITPLVGTVPIVSLSGRPPATADEIAIGPATADALHVGVGGKVQVAGHSMTVSGITFVPQNPHNDYTDGAWLTTAGFNLVQPDQSKDKFREIRFSFKPGVDVSAALGRVPPAVAPGGLGPGSEIFPVEQQTELSSLKPQPLLLGGFLIVLAIGAVGHGLATAVRRRRHDVAVLRSLGLTRWQTRMIVVTQATVLAFIGLVVGIPLGIAAGRTSWRTLAHATPVYYVAPVALLALLLAIPATIAVANALAALPARRAARMHVGEILRAE
jgi:hypothetical protein